MISNVNFTGNRYLIVKDPKNRVIECLSHEIKENPDRPDDPDVVICKGVDPKTGQVIDQTLPLSHVQRMHRVMSNKILGILVPALFWGGAPAIDAYTRYQAQFYDETTANYTIKTAEQAKDYIELTNDVKNIDKIGSQGDRFIGSLAENKDSLMKDLNLSSKEYDDLADIAIKIANNESALGENLKYRAMMMGESYYIGAWSASKKRANANPNDKNGPILSRGMTQYKIAMANDEEKALFDKYGITYDNLETNIQAPEKSAIATMIHLGTLRQGYDEYLQKMDENMPNIFDPEVQASIENAKSILFNDDLRPAAINALTQVNDSEEEAKCLAEAGLEQKDLDDLRLLSKGIRISHKAYTGAGWNGKYIRPYESRKADLSCANLLKAAAGVGYIANIDNTAEIII